jgi:hypothetical protein
VPALEPDGLGVGATDGAALGVPVAEGDGVGGGREGPGSVAVTLVAGRGVAPTSETFGRAHNHAPSTRHRTTSAPRVGTLQGCNRVDPSCLSASSSSLVALTPPEVVEGGTVEDVGGGAGSVAGP